LLSDVSLNCFTGSTSPRNIEFQDEGVKLESDRRRREYLITWQVCVL